MRIALKATIVAAGLFLAVPAASLLSSGEVACGHNLAGERTAAGFTAARARETFGRPAKLSTEQVEMAVSEARNRRSLADIADSLSISRSTLRRALGRRRGH